LPQGALGTGPLTVYCGSEARIKAKADPAPWGAPCFSSWLAPRIGDYSIKVDRFLIAYQ